MAKHKLRRPAKGMKGHLHREKSPFEKQVEDAYARGLKEGGAPISFWAGLNKTLDQAPHLVNKDSETLRTAKMIRDVLNKGLDGKKATLEELSAEARELDIAMRMAENFTLFEAIYSGSQDYTSFTTESDPVMKLYRKNRGMRRTVNKIVEPNMKLLRKRMDVCRRFHLADEFVEHAVHKANTLTPYEVFESFQVAKLPFEHVWLEFNNAVRLGSEADEEYVDPDKAAPRGAVMMSRIPGDNILLTSYLGRPGENAFPQMCAFILGNDTTRGLTAIKHISGTLSYDIALTKMRAERGDTHAHGYEMTPWDLGQYDKENDYVCEPSAITRILASKSRLITEPFFWNTWLGMEHALDKEVVSHGLANSIVDMRGDLKLWVTVLAMMNIVPIKYTHKPVKPTSDNYQGKQKPYLDYQVVEIEAGRQKVINVVNHAFRAIREKAKKRAHEVRGHWRVYHKGTPKEFKVWVTEHQRGDASLGFVRQTWEVTTGDKHA